MSDKFQVPEIVPLTTGDSQSGREQNRARPPADVVSLEEGAPDVQEETRRRGYWLKAVDNSPPDAIIEVDLVDLVTSWDEGAESKFGFAAHEIIGRSVVLIIPPDRINEWILIRNRIVDSGEEIERFKTRWRSKSGTIIPISLNASPLGEELPRLISSTNKACEAGKRHEHEVRLHTGYKTIVTNICFAEREAMSRSLARMNDKLWRSIRGILRYFSLRRLDGELAGEAIGQAPTLPDAQCAPALALKILIVDDMAVSREIAGYFLRAAGYEVVLVEGGAEAIASVAASDFDIVLMDVQMPQMDGIEATRRIRALTSTAGQVPIVALTVQVLDEQITECRRAGMNGHVSKPFSQEELIAAVRRMSRR